MPNTDIVNVLRRRRRANRAFTLVEVAFSLVVLAMMAFMVAACCPMITRVAASSNYYAQAAFIAQHKIEQIRSAQFTNAVTSSKFDDAGSPPDASNYTWLSANKIVDTGQTTAPYTFTTVDNLVGTTTNPSFFPQGTVGTITITADQNATKCLSKSTNCNVVDVTVVITWPSMGVGVTNSYTAVSKMASVPH
jgi:Tfp pilus assembly protein PilV